jgi:hypothetical protein
MKQTAVEWLILTLYPTISIRLSDAYIKEITDKAKEMEKQQIINSHLTGLIHPLEMEATKQAQHYYNETYGGNNAE